jgi:D-3-phosphoglycerate dehydrogenase
MKIVVTAPYGEKELKELKKWFDEVVYAPYTITGKLMNGEKTQEFLDKENPDAFICELDQVTEKNMETHSLKFIGVCRAAPVNIDVAAASKLGIPVLVTPARNAQAVAELLVAGLLNFLRKIPQASAYISKGQWRQGPDAYLRFKGEELAGRSIGFVGFGAVARHAAQILAAFPCGISYYDPYVEVEGYKKASIEDIFSKNDIVSIHLPVTPETKGMINKNLLNLMGPKTIFVNTARSEVMDMKYVRRILKEKRIGGGIFDVYDTEPAGEEDLELIHLDNVFATPHIGGATSDVILHHSRIMNDRIAAYLDRGETEILFNNKQIADK